MDLRAPYSPSEKALAVRGRRLSPLPFEQTFVHAWKSSRYLTLLGMSATPHFPSLSAPLRLPLLPALLVPRLRLRVVAHLLFQQQGCKRTRVTSVEAQIISFAPAQ